jgi:hypothetical protein
MPTSDWSSSSVVDPCFEDAKWLVKSWAVVGLLASQGAGSLAQEGLCFVPRASRTSQTEPALAFCRSQPPLRSPPCLACPSLPDFSGISENF